jgi:DNA polymerase-1
MTTLIFDANNLAYRVKYTHDLSHNAEDVSVTYGFLRVMVSNARDLDADSVVVCWDNGIPAFRRELLPEYKTGRKKDWDELEYQSFAKQMDDIRRVLPAMGVVSVWMPDTEADDLMYHASRLVAGDCAIVTTDGDMLQAVTPDGRVQVWHPTNKVMYGWDNFEEHIKVKPAQYLDYKTLVGDNSDGIKGVPGIGHVVATGILDVYGSIEAAYVAMLKGDEWLAGKLGKTRLSAVDLEYLDRVRAVMDLSVDRCDTEPTIRNAVDVWIPFKPTPVKLFMVSKGFVSMMGGKVPVAGVCENLRRPELVDVRKPETKHSRLVVRRRP